MRPLNFRSKGSNWAAWDGHLRFTGSGWSFYDFRRDRWTNVVNDDNRRYLRNAYRVLLTRARQGMVIFVPSGDPSDPTRSPEFYDSTFNYLAELGIPRSGAKRFSVSVRTGIMSCAERKKLRTNKR
ncbi:MAG TPA: DNA/RNA helicase domain-containing protein [Candidatus Binatia bacterium]